MGDHMRLGHSERNEAAACPPLTQAAQGIAAACHTARAAMRAESAIISVHSSESPNEAGMLRARSAMSPVHTRTRDGASHRHGCAMKLTAAIGRRAHDTRHAERRRACCARRESCG
eukprot:5184027-Prymnesium_polylepis.1